MTKIAVGMVALTTVILALLGTSAHGEPPPRKLISLTEVAPEVSPVSDYTGDFWNRSTMFGDPGGVRQDLYEKGFSLDVDMTQVVQGLVSGGVDENAWGYNGLLDYSMYLDTGKLGLWSGGLLAARAQTSWFENDLLRFIWPPVDASCFNGDQAPRGGWQRSLCSISSRETCFEIDPRLSLAIRSRWLSPRRQFRSVQTNN